MKEKQKILIVDDSSTIIKIVEGFLKDSHFEILSALGGKKGITVTREQMPDLVLLDVDMPDMDGFETCEILKADKKTAKIPILFFTASQDLETKVKCFEIGGQDFIHKPVQKEELVARINTHLTLKRLQEELMTKIEDEIRLIRILSHDISNPLTIILGQAQMVLASTQAQKNEKLTHRMKRIKKSSEHIYEIIEHVREMEALKSGKKELKLGPVNLKPAFFDAIDALQHKLERKNITLDFQPGLEALEQVVVAERVSLTTNVLGNLLSNAIKFSYPDSMLRITISREGRLVTVQLKDSGTGMPADILENIFSMSYSTSRSGTMGEKGTGFGMPIVKKYMQIYGGEIKIESKNVDEFPANHGTEIELVFKRFQQGEINSEEQQHG
ncbi:MAG: hybrid sensor histidine kinase/response regulator [bacterium]|nr:hybrid sensor histidine kinase/response regulator [bacterium]